MIPAHFTAIALGILLDLLIGDPKSWPHPVRWIGKLISWLTKMFNKGRFRVGKGALVLIITIGFVSMSALALVVFSYSVHIAFGVAVEGLLIAFGLAQRSLRGAALQVYRPVVDGNLPEARQQLGQIVGRDTENLSESEVIRGTIETVSENISDGVTAPLFWAFLFGAPGLWAYKAVNTLDSMIGYRTEAYKKFGLFSARTDDVLNYIPARLTGFLILLYTPNKGELTYRKRFMGWGKESRRHPSVNSGFLEAATAWQLGIKLGGKNTYKGEVSERPEIGPGLEMLEAKHIRFTIHQLHWASLVFWLLMMVIGIYIYVP